MCKLQHIGFAKKNLESTCIRFLNLPCCMMLSTCILHSIWCISWILRVLCFIRLQLSEVTQFTRKDLHNMIWYIFRHLDVFSGSTIFSSVGGLPIFFKRQDLYSRLHGLDNAGDLGYLWKRGNSSRQQSCRVGVFLVGGFSLDVKLLKGLFCWGARVTWRWHENPPLMSQSPWNKAEPPLCHHFSEQTCLF